MPTVATRAELECLLADDVPYGDLTTEALGIGGAAGMMEFAARDSMVLALAEDAAAIIEMSGCSVDLSAGFDVVQLEKFLPPDVATLVERLRSARPRPVVAVAGGVNPGNAAAYAQAGADVLVTSSPYMAKPRDVQVRIRPNA
jgi:molybdenum transport protein